MTDKKLKEGLGDMAHMAERDHEVQMARAELYKIAKYAIKLHELLKNVTEAEGLEGWQQAKITKAGDYISSVFHSLEYDQKVMTPESKTFKSSMTESEQEEYKLILEKAKSKAQQKFMGMVHAAQKGEKPASKEVAKVAKDMPKKAAKDYASTKHKGLPKKKTKESIDATAKKILGEGTEYELYLLLNEAPAGNVVNKIKTGLAKLPRNVAAKATDIIKKTPKAAWPLAAAALMTVAGPDAAQAGSDLANNMADSAMQGLIGKLQGIATDTANTAGELQKFGGGAADAAQGAAEVTRDQLKSLHRELGGGSAPTLTDLIQNGVDLDKVKNILTKFGITDSVKIEMALQQIDGTNLRPFVDWVAQNK